MATFGRKGKEANSDQRPSRNASQLDCMLQAARFEKLYRESYPIVYGRILYQMRDEDAARDVTSEAFLRAARFFNRFDPSKSKFSTWVSAIARNCMTDYYRKQKPHTPIESVPESTLAIEEDNIRRIEDADLARQLLAVLSDDERDIVIMKYYGRKKNSEIAEEIGMNPSTVATRLQRALAKMRAAAK